jgi:hypothetical protein
VESLLQLPTSSTSRPSMAVDTFNDPAIAVRSAKNHQPRQRQSKSNDVEILPPITGIIHLAAYSPVDCRLNPTDCRSVELGGMEAILHSLRKRKEPGTQLEYAADRPWITLPRRIESIISVS